MSSTVLSTATSSSTTSSQAASPSAVPARAVPHVVRLTSVSHPGALVRALAASRELWAPHVRFDPTAPALRVVWADDRHEALLGAWLPGQASPVHTHLGRPGALLVLQGVLEETTWVTATDGAEPGRRHAVRRHLVADEVRSYGAVHVHGLRNDGTDPVIALHVLARA